MSKKRCTKCGEVKSLSSFSWRNKARNKRQSWCKECFKKEDLFRYYDGPRKRQCREITRAYRDKMKRLIDRYKVFCGCQACGYKRCSAALDFHHPSGKDIPIGRALYHLGESRLKAEIRKCVVLCATCHRELHHMERSSSG